MEAYLDMLHFLMQPQTELQRNPKTNNTQTCQKIELYGSLTTKDLKKPHSSRRVGGEEMRSWGGVVRRHSVVQTGSGSGRKAVPHSRVVDKNQEGHLGSQ